MFAFQALNLHPAQAHLTGQQDADMGRTPKSKESKKKAAQDPPTRGIQASEHVKLSDIPKKAPKASKYVQARVREKIEKHWANEKQKGATEKAQEKSSQRKRKPFARKDSPRRPAKEPKTKKKASSSKSIVGKKRAPTIHREVGKPKSVTNTKWSGKASKKRREGTNSKGELCFGFFLFSRGRIRRGDLQKSPRQRKLLHRKVSPERKTLPPGNTK